MKALTTITQNLNEISTILEGVQKLQNQFMLTRLVMDCNEILIKEQEAEKEINKKKYSDKNELKESYIALHDAKINTYESRKARALRLRSQINAMFEIMEVKPQYGEFLYTRRDWDNTQDMDINEFSDKYGVLV